MTTNTAPATGLIAPHGGKLINRYVDGAEAQKLRDQAKSLPQVNLIPRAVSDAHMIAQGAFSPLEGFMVAADYHKVVKEMHLANGLPWTLPITLSVSKEQAHSLKPGTKVALVAEADGALVGVMEVREAFEYNKEDEAKNVFKTTETAHPGVAYIHAQGEMLIGGPIQVLPGRPPLDPAVVPHYRTPAEVRAEIAKLGWKTVVGFQTRNPVHRAHEYIQKMAMEIVDGLLLHPLVGETKSDDVPADVRMKCYEVIIEHYYPKNRVLLTDFPAFMRYGGPREAVFHAINRKNYGCTHFIVGRDHAGVGSYYGTYEAQEMFKNFTAQELGIQPLMFENSFFCKKCGNMGSTKTCPHTPEDRVNLSGTQVRTMLSQGQIPPVEFTRPEVAKVLIAAYTK